MNSMRRVYQAGSIAFLIFALFVVFEARKLNYYTELGPGPGFFPLWLGGALALLSVVWFIQVSRQELTAIADDFVPSKAGILRILSVIGAVAAFGFLVDAVGFQVMMFVFLLFLLTVLGRQNIFLTLAICIAGSFGLFYVFGNVLDVQLPRSSIEFLKNLGL